MIDSLIQTNVLTNHSPNKSSAQKAATANTPPANKASPPNTQASTLSNNVLISALKESLQLSAINALIYSSKFSQNKAPTPGFQNISGQSTNPGTHTQPLTQLLQNLNGIINSPLFKTLLPTETKEIFLIIKNQLPNIQALMSAASLKNLIRSSGIFMEYKILHELKQQYSNKNYRETDLQLNLLKLRDTLKKILNTNEQKSLASRSSTQQPLAYFYKSLSTGLNQKSTAKDLNQLRLQLGQILLATEGAISQIKSNQVSSLLSEPGNLPTLTTLLPFIAEERINTLKISIQQDADNNQEQSSMWLIKLYFNFDKLGDVLATIALRGDHLNILIDCEHYSTRHLFDKNSHVLDEMLNETGLTVNKFECRTDPVSASAVQQSSIINITS